MRIFQSSPKIQLSRKVGLQLALVGSLQSLPTHLFCISSYAQLPYCHIRLFYSHLLRFLSSIILILNFKSTLYGSLYFLPLQKSKLRSGARNTGQLFTRRVILSAHIRASFLGQRRKYVAVWETGWSLRVVQVTNSPWH